MKMSRLSFNHDQIPLLRQGLKKATRRPITIKKGWDLTTPEVVTLKAPHRQKGKSGALIKKIGSVHSFTELIIAPCLKGDIAYAVEPYAALIPKTNQAVNYSDHPNSEIRYRADEPAHIANAHTQERGFSWVRSKFMPREISRFTLPITDVRIEKLQSITNGQAIAEGIHQETPFPISAFRQVWDDIYGNWRDNPWVWVIEFDVIEMNIDEYLKSKFGQLAEPIIAASWT